MLTPHIQNNKMCCKYRKHKEVKKNHLNVFFLLVAVLWAQHDFSLTGQFNSNVGINIFSYTWRCCSLMSCFYRKVDLQVQLRVSATCSLVRRAQSNLLRGRPCPRFTFPPQNEPYKTYCRWTVSLSHACRENVKILLSIMITYLLWLITNHFFFFFRASLKPAAAVLLPLLYTRE